MDEVALTGSTLVLNRRLLPKQNEFVHAQEREVLFSGAYGASKSVALCMKLIAHASIPGNHVGLCRKTMASLRASTLRTLLQGDEKMGPALPYYKGTPCFTYHKSDQTIQVHGGGTIKLFGLDDEDKLGSQVFGAVGVEEATELRESEWLKLLSRIRLPIYKPEHQMTNQLFGVTNPDAPTHFLYLRFFGLDATAHSRRAITTRSFDNPYLLDNYVQWLRSLSGQQRDRYVEGKWVAFGGAFYDNFSRDIHVVHRDLSEFASFAAGVDDGCVHPACILVFGEDGDGNQHVVQEWYERGHTHAEIADVCEQIHSHYDLDGFACDPAAAGLKEELKRRSLPLLSTDNDRQKTSRLLYDYLKIGPSGRPRMTIEPTVIMLPMELESIGPHPTKNEPRKGSTSDQGRDPRDGEIVAGGLDHAHDAARYRLAALPNILTGHELWTSTPSRIADYDPWDDSGFVTV